MATVGSAFYQMTTSATTNAWIIWNSDYSQAGSFTSSGSYAFTRSQTEIAEQERKIKEEQEARAAAKQRAKVLLMEHLDEEQKKSLEKDRKFIVHSCDKKRVYVIKHGRAGNIELLNDEGIAVAKFCIHPAIQCPDEDTMLAQKLLLETNEAQFLKIANKTVLGRAA
jgi:hypothetical protein